MLFRSLAEKFISVWLVGRFSLINMGGGRLGEVVAHGASTANAPRGNLRK